MKHLCGLLLAAVLFSATASAQRSMGYWFVAPGAVTSHGVSAFSVHAGGGGELAIWKGISAGIEAGAVGLKSDYRDTVTGVASVNGIYHFFHSKTARYDPFVTGGYSLFFRGGTANLANYGAGLNYWFSRSMAVRVEVRDHVNTQGPPVHYWGVRMGLSFTELQP
jgi:hypothetical protein